MDRAEATGFGASVVGHGALLLAAWLIVNRPVPPEIGQAFEVSYVDEVGLTSASPNPTPSAAAATAPEVGPIEDAPQEVIPEPPAPPAPPTPAPRQAARPSPAPPQRPATAPARPQSSPTRNPGTQTRRPGLGDLNPNSFGSDPQRRSGPPAATFGPQAQASLNAALLRALAPCETQSLPAPEAAGVRVRVAVALDPQGNLVSARVTGVTNADGELARYANRMRDLALAVVRGCTPIRGLPAEFYDVPRGWRSFNYTFPRPN